MKKFLALGVLLSGMTFPVAQATHVEALSGNCGTPTDGYAIRSYFGDIDLDVYATDHDFFGLTRKQYKHIKRNGDLVVMYWAVLRAGTADMMSFQIGDGSCDYRSYGFGFDTYVYAYGPYTM